MITLALFDHVALNIVVIAAADTALRGRRKKTTEADGEQEKARAKMTPDQSSPVEGKSKKWEPLRLPRRLFLSTQLNKATQIVI